jgi:hypothetical protein
VKETARVNPPVPPTKPIDRHHRIATFGRAVVLACAAVISFSALYDLAILCGFRPLIAILFPVMVDAGAAVALAGWKTSPFARRVALALLFSTVAGNAVAHILVAYGLRPHWVVVVLVGGLAPAVLAATWQLTTRETVEDQKTANPTVAEVVEPVVAPVVKQPTTPPVEMLEVVPAPVVETDLVEQARKLVATEGAGRKRLMALGLTEHQARRIAATKTNGKVVA